MFGYLIGRQCSRHLKRLCQKALSNLRSDGEMYKIKSYSLLKIIMRTTQQFSITLPTEMDCVY